ncbi:MAG TPA: ATP-binding protein [Puia sp.]|jgi:two-component system NarL family sensor kinase|nr:ATP-binding protein [Puia sp.]
MKWILFLVLVTGVYANAQNRKIDDLKLKLKTSKSDTGKIEMLIALGRQYSYFYPDTAISYFDEGISLSKKINYENGELLSSLFKGEVLATQGNYYKAQELELEVLHRALDIKDENLIGGANIHLGNLYFYQGNYQHAVDYYSKVIQVDKNDTDFEEAIKGLKGRAFLAVGNLDSAYTNSKRASDIELRRKNITWILPAVTLAAILSKQGKIDSALSIYKKYENMLPGSVSTLEMNIPMSKILFLKKQNDSAIFYLKKTIAAATAKEYLEEAGEASGLLANFYKSESNLDSAYLYLALHNLFRDSLINLNKGREIQNEEFDNKLYNEQIQKTEEQLQDRIKIYGFAFAVLIFIIITFLFWRNNKLKKREFSLLHKQKQDEKLNLQNEFQQTLLRTQLEIQEQTLKNISWEIHDNIGQILSLAKLNLGTVDMNDSVTIHEKIDDSKNLISKAIQDLRDVAKSLNTDHIITLGLAKSIEHELEIIKKTGWFEIIFEPNGEIYKLEPQKELILFRIVQEVFNNIIKHAKAGIIVVKMNYEHDSFSLKIQDNGRGFDVNDPNITGAGATGLGIKNMWDRAQIIGAQLTIASSAGEGTTVDIKLPISN